MSVTSRLRSKSGELFLAIAVKALNDLVFKPTMTSVSTTLADWWNLLGLGGLVNIPQLSQSFIICIPTKSATTNKFTMRTVKHSRYRLSTLSGNCHIPLSVLHTVTITMED